MSKCLFLFIEGALSTSDLDKSALSTCKHQTLDQITNQGGTTLIHTRKVLDSSQINEDTALLTQLFDYYDPIMPVDEEEEKEWTQNPNHKREKQSLFFRFKKLKVHTLTSNERVLPIFEHRKDTAEHVSSWGTELVEKACDLLNANDILIIHDNISHLENSQKVQHIERLDALYREIQEAFPKKHGMKIYSTLVLSSPYNTVLPVVEKKSIVSPLQSYQQKNGQDISHLVHNKPSMVCVQYCQDETRRDNNTVMSESYCINNAGNSSMLIDFIIPEVAYKLRKSPKYGA